MAKRIFVRIAPDSELLVPARRCLGINLKQRRVRFGFGDHYLTAHQVTASSMARLLKLLFTGPFEFTHTEGSEAFFCEVIQ